MRSRISGFIVLALMACREKAAPPVTPATPPVTGRQVSALRSDPACAAPFDAPGAREKLRTATGELKLGVLAGLKDADEENVASIRKLVAELKRRGADVLVADGDLGDNSDEQETLLGALAESGLPVLAVAGNRELRSELDAVEAELRKKGSRIVDLSHTRIVDLGDATVVGLAGAFERRHLHSEGACVYVQKDIEAVSAILDRVTPPAIFVAAVPPRGQDLRALDVSEGQNLGDPRLSQLLQKAQFGIFGQVWESGGRAVDGHGAPVPPKTEAARLYLNPGAADRTPWPMADGATVAGQGALLTVRGRKAAWEPVRLVEEKR
jgi:Icc-related predicted phosphoesterase